MTIFFITSQPDICQIFQKNLPDHKCFIYTSFEPMYDLIFVKNLLPDLIIADYLANNHSVFNAYKYMDEIKKRIPLIYYNDPVLTAPTRSRHWKFLIEYMDPDNSELDLSKFDSVFNTIETLVESSELSPYIKLMQKPEPLPKKLLINYLYDEYNLDIIAGRLNRYKKISGMTDGLFILLECLYKSHNKPLSLYKLQEEYAKINRPVKIESLKVELSRLRSIIKKNPEIRIDIIKRKDGYELIEF